MRTFTFVTLAALSLPAIAKAALPPDGWPQSRRDAALSGRIDEPALPSARLRWQVLTGVELAGEPGGNGCTVVVTSGDGRVHAFNARNGAPLWSHAPSYAVLPAGVSSALAIDGDAIHVGLPADPLLDRALRALAAIRTALVSYTIDNNAYPPGPDLAAALTPTYIRSLPPNPVTGTPMVESETPSVGDYRYESVAAGSDFHLGIWGKDGGLLDLGDGCPGGGPGQQGGLAATWPVSAERGGTPTTLDLVAGSLTRQDLSAGIASTLAPTMVGDSVDWASQETMRERGAAWWGWRWWGGQAPVAGRGGAVRRSDAAGATAWTHLAWGGARGAAAHDGAGNAFVSLGASRLGSASMDVARRLGAGCESYAIDNNAYPPSGDLEADLLPIYMSCMPPSFLHDGPMIEGDAASGGDYRYESPDLQSYLITLWDEDGGILTSLDTGSFVVAGTDRPPQVASIAADGSSRWRVRIGLESQDVTPTALDSAGSVVVGTTGGDLLWLDPATGAERARVDVGEPLSLPPAVLPDGGVVVVTGNGSVVAHRPDRSERWRRWMGATVTAAPATTADGVTYVADLDGMLTALAWADGSVLWRAYLGGANRAGLTTTPVQSLGWIYVGRSDGALLAVVPRETGGRPVIPVPLLSTGEKSATTAGWTWEGVAVPPDPGAHWHLLRWRGSLQAAPDDLLAPHPYVSQRMLDDTANGPLLFYSLVAADCGENTSL